MVSRRKILSRSRDDLNLDQNYSQQEEEEDIWYQKDKLYKEHIQEVLDKWTQIDDEIWAKVIVFERNRRVAKAYARAPVLTINGSDDGFDGMRIGLCGFDNPMRDPKTDEFKRHIGQGVKIKMDDAGNILIRRYAKSNVYIKSTASNSNEETSIGADILKLPNQALESEKIVKLFDMKKFQSNVNRELRRAYPDRRRLETQCLSAVAFVKSESDILDCPVWVLIVNVVAMDMLKSKLPPVQRPVVDIKNRPRIPIPDEDPYSVAGNGSGGSGGSGGSSGSSGFGGGANNGTPNGHVAATREQLLLQTQQLAHKRSEKPPKLPPRDNIYSHDIPKPDYDDIEESRIKLSRGKSDKGKDNKKYDDPYYCGLRARVPNFGKPPKPSKEVKEPLVNNNSNTINNNTLNNNNNIINSNMNTLSQKKTSMIHMPIAPLHPYMHHQQMLAAAAHHVHHAAAPQPTPQQAAAAAHHHHQMMWQARSFESGIGIYSQMNYMLDHHPYHCPYRDHVQNYSNFPILDKYSIDPTPFVFGSAAVTSNSNGSSNDNSIYRSCRPPPMRRSAMLIPTSHDYLRTTNCNRCHASTRHNPLYKRYGADSSSAPPLLPHQVIKWCSESDVSDLDRTAMDAHRIYEIHDEDKTYQTNNSNGGPSSMPAVVGPRKESVSRKMSAQPMRGTSIPRPTYKSFKSSSNGNIYGNCGGYKSNNQNNNQMTNSNNNAKHYSLYEGRSNGTEPTLNTDFNGARKISVSTESFFENPDEQNKPNANASNIYDRIKHIDVHPSNYERRQQQPVIDQRRSRRPSSASVTVTKSKPSAIPTMQQPTSKTTFSTTNGTTTANSNMNNKTQMTEHSNYTSLPPVPPPCWRKRPSRANPDYAAVQSLYDTNSIVNNGNGNRRLESDMESIYGYLKPRKPRSLSMKRIQIQDY